MKRSKSYRQADEQTAAARLRLLAGEQLAGELARPA